MPRPRVHRWRRSALVIGSAAVAAFLARPRKPAAQSSHAAPPPVAPPPVASAQDELDIDALLARDNRRGWSAFWLEAAIAIAVLLLVAVPLFFAWRGRTAYVLVHDLRQGDPIRVEDLQPMRMPRLDHAFRDLAALAGGVQARNDLQSGSVLHTTDLVRLQAVATTDLAAGDRVEPSHNVTFKPLPYAADALTPNTTARKTVTRFVAAGSLLHASVLADAPPPAKAADIAVPLRAFSGALDVAEGAEVVVVATPRNAGNAAAFEHVRIVSVDRGTEPPKFIVAMTQAEAMRFAALPAADFTIMQRR
ncbi:MAG: hypothetical protein JO197_04405 [Acidobacteria bacterium]|nr:hypothetical protein [Acidobacteriota bacterium]MBV9478543.1 hypothetical protein [Acidobacteriota bacterium]